MTTARQLLIEGLTDAAGFIAGALAGWGIGAALGWNMFASGYGPQELMAIALVGIGGGLGLKLARALRQRHIQRAKA
jgi:hypothetical protein